MVILTNSPPTSLEIFSSSVIWVTFYRFLHTPDDAQITPTCSTLLRCSPTHTHTLANVSENEVKYPATELLKQSKLWTRIFSDILDLLNQFRPSCGESTQHMHTDLLACCSLLLRPNVPTHPDVKPVQVELFQCAFRYAESLVAYDQMTKCDETVSVCFDFVCLIDYL